MTTITETPPETEPKTYSQEFVQRLRAEAAESRTLFREFQAATQHLIPNDQFAAATKADAETIAKLERTLLIKDIQGRYALPSELAELLQGTTASELDAHARSLSRFVPAPDSHGDHDDDDMNPRELALADRQRTLR